MLKENLSGNKTAYGAKRMPNQKTISNSNYISILSIPDTFSQHNGKCIASFTKNAMHLKTGFLLDYQVLFLLLNGPQIEKSLQFNRSISINL